MATQIIFIGGIHGAGKGTVCRSICSAHNFTHLSASDLLKWQEVSADEKNKKVADIQNTQDRLIVGLNAAIKEGEQYLLDGHFCLLNSSGKPEKVPTETFIQIAPVAIVVVIDAVQLIIDRLDQRDRKRYEFETLNQLQLLEVQYAKEIASMLSVPFISIENGNPRELVKFIKQWN